MYRTRQPCRPPRLQLHLAGCEFKTAPPGCYEDTDTNAHCQGDCQGDCRWWGELPVPQRPVLHFCVLCTVSTPGRALEALSRDPCQAGEVNISTSSCAIVASYPSYPGSRTVLLTFTRREFYLVVTFDLAGLFQMLTESWNVDAM